MKLLSYAVLALLLSPAVASVQGVRLQLDPAWEFVADTVMGGNSTGRIETVGIDGLQATRLVGAVSLDNNGGFVQMAFDVKDDGGRLDASAYSGIELRVRGNGQTYDLRLRTDQLEEPWQSYRADFLATPDWQTVRIPFAEIMPHRTDVPFDPGHLRRIGILAIGREFQADVAVARVALY